MMEHLYDLWKEISSISAALVIAGVLVANKGSRWKNLPRLLRVLLQMVLYILAIIIAGSLIVGCFFSKVPVLKGKTVAEGEQLLQDNHLKITLPPGTEFDESMYTATIINHDYDSGQIIPRKTKITVYTSNSGYELIQEMTVVPDVVGKTYKEAVELLESNNLFHRITTLEDELTFLDTSIVIRQSISAGISIPEKSVIELVLANKIDDLDLPHDSAQMDMFVVPGVIGMRQDEATALLLAAGFYEVRAFGGDTYSLDSNYVISQSFSEGESVVNGSTIELNCITKPLDARVTVPNALGMEQTQATQLLTEAGLQYQVWWTEENNTGATEYYIIDQSIPEGSTVTAGTLIRLELSDKRP
ncbi:MAG: PASTA domain-containing protein [Lachnospiraceae bacterium]|nr:PASTA domain-containing protein [Lachnospiraceae bacterium]